MASATNDHYIPQFLLREFEDRTPANPSNYRIIRVALDTGTIDRRAVRRTASEEGFYDAPQRDAAGDRLEHIYGRVESAAAPVIRRLNEGDINLSEGEREALAAFIAHQASRTVTYRQVVDTTFAVGAAEIQEYILGIARRISPLHEAMMAQYIEMTRTPEGDGDFLARQSLQMAQDATPIVRAMDWTIVEAPVGTAFILGDQPVLTIREHDRLPADQSDAVGNSGQMPLSPTRLLWMQRAKTPGAVGALSGRVATPDEVEVHNRLSLAISDRFVFTGNQGMAEWAAEHRNDEKRITLPDGTTVRPGTR